MKEAVRRTRLGLQPLPQGLLSKSPPLSHLENFGIHTELGRRTHRTSFRFVISKKNSPQMTMIMNYLLFEATEYISKWVGSRNGYEISNLFSRTRGKVIYPHCSVSWGSCKTDCSCNSISLEDQAELTHRTQYEVKILFFHRIPFVSTWILTKPVLETDL